MSTYPPTDLTTPTREHHRIGYDRDAVHAALDEAVMCHVGYVIDGRPLVLPQLHARVGEDLILHGSSGARALRAAAGGGVPVCVTVTLLDGLVLARSAFNHSINYRSVVVHGIAEPITDDDALQAALTSLVEAIVPGRSDHVRGPSPKELRATTVLRVPLEQSSIKVRSGPPEDEDEDYDLPYWAGVLPLTSIPGPPETTPDLRTPQPVPDHVTGWSRP